MNPFTAVAVGEIASYLHMMLNTEWFGKLTAVV